MKYKKPADLLATIIPRDAEVEDYEQKVIEIERRQQQQLADERIRFIPPRYKSCTFESFVTDKPSIIDHMEAGGSAILYGPNGTGKTHLAYAAVRHQIEQGNDARYILAADFFALVKQEFSTGRQDYKPYYSCPYLVIDEIDKRYGSQTEFIALYRLINHRYNEMLPTVLITNSGKEELIEVIGISSFDRIIEDGKLIHMDGKNWRRS